MANIKQQKKRILTNEKRHAAVSSFKASVKTAMKAVYVAVEKKDLEVYTPDLPSGVGFQNYNNWEEIDMPEVSKEDRISELKQDN